MLYATFIKKEKMNKKEALNILGFKLEDDPSKKEVNKAFKKKAAKAHPDVNKSEGAEKEFKKINAAQEYLQNPPKQKYFFNTEPVNYQDLHSFFNNFVGPKVRFSVPPIYSHVSISFAESVLGCKKKITIQRTRKCGECKCKSCNGNGVVETILINGSVRISQTAPCDVCKGLKFKIDDCKKCSNKRIQSETIELSVKIPGGIPNGHGLRLGAGGNFQMNKFTSSTGDIILNISVRQEPNMRIVGNDVISILDISLLEALQGVTKKVPTVLGEKKIIIEQNTKHKDIVSIERHGVSRVGKHIFELNIQYPKDTDKLIDILSEGK